MPLLPGKKNIGTNISTEESHGKKHSQAVAIALRVAGVPKRANGGHVGALRGDTPGRADEIPTTVPDGSHVVPADICAHIGGGNSANGLSILEKKFPHTEHRAEGGLVAPSIPHMTSVPGTPHMSPTQHLIGIPRPHMTGLPHLVGVPRMGAFGSIPHITNPRLAAGGETQKPVPVKLSDGEFVLGPEWVKKIGHGDPQRGHRAIDEWILQMRKASIKKLSSLPPPVGFKK